jgi:hypothetical protein
VHHALSLLASVIGLGVMEGAIAGLAIAQSTPGCQPPQTGEFLLMVVNQAPDTSDQLRNLLPVGTPQTVCNYLGTVVTRVGGFADFEVANSWAQYLTDTVRLQAFVARPADVLAPTSPATTAAALQPLQSSSPTIGSTPPVSSTASSPSAPSASTATTFPAPNTVQPSPSPAATNIPVEAPPSPTLTPAPVATATPAAQPTTRTTGRVSFNPQPLGTGYAVLVDYSNQPEVAVTLQQILQTPVGLVAYEQHPYLLALYTQELATAANVLKTLSDRSFSVVLVDSRRAILLTPSVASVTPQR